MSSSGEPPPPPPPPPPPSPPPPSGESVGRRLIVRIRLPLLQLPNQEEGDAVGTIKNATALQSYGSESLHSPHEKPLERPHEGEASRSGDVEPPSELLAGVHEREEAAVQQRGSPSPCSREAYCLIRDAARAGLCVVAAEPYPCTDCTETFGREKKMQGHRRWLHRPRSASSSSSSEEVPTPKKARKKPKLKRAAVKMEPCQDEAPLPFPMVQGATSRRERRPIHAAGEDLSDPARSPEFWRWGTQVGVGGREDVVSLRTHQAGHVFGARSNGHVNQAGVPPAENPEVTVSESTVTAHNAIAIEDDSSDNANANATNATGGDAGNANPTASLLAPDVAPVLPMERASAGAIEVIVVDDDSSDEENVVYGRNAAALLPRPRVPAAPTAADTVSVKGKNALHNEARARCSNGGHGKAVAGYSNAGHSKAAAGYSSGGYGYGYGKAIAIGGQSKTGRPRKPYSCADCGETFYSPQALGGHVNGHRSKEKKKSTAMPDLQSTSACRSDRHVCPVCDIVFPTGHELGWHRKKVHYGGLVIGSASNTSSSSAPRPPANAVELSEATAMTSNAAAVHGTANTVRRRSFFPASAGSAVLALPALNPVQRMATISNPAVPGLVSPAATAATGSWSWSLPATTSSFVPAIPLQNHGENPRVEIAVAPGNRAGCTIRAFSLQDQDQENPPQELAMAPGNGEHRSTRRFGSDTSRQFPSQNQVNPPEEVAAVAPSNGEQRSIRLLGIDVSPALPSQNQEGNPPQEIVPGNCRPRNILLFGVNLAEDPKEPKK